MPDAELGPADRLNIAVAEFNALRAEILSRSTAQQNLLNLTIVAVGAIGSVAFSDASRQPVLLILPIVSCIFGMLYFDHGVANSTIARYIKDELAPAVRSESDWSQALAWEDFVRRIVSSQTTFRRSAAQFGIPILFAFLFVPVMVSVYMVPQLASTWLWLAWSVGVVAEMLTAAVGLGATRYWKASPPQTRPQSE